jgi:uncharacterized protein (TIGR03000 family)
MPKLPAPTPDSTTVNTAQVVIKAATEVRISVNGQRTERDAAEMTFLTPALQQGKSYSYEVNAEFVRDGKLTTETKRVTVKAGHQTMVDFSDLNLGAIAQAAMKPATVTVNLPEDGKLFVDGAPYPISANQRTFNTPALRQGKDYYYELKAQVVRDGKTQTETQTITVEPGKHVQVNFKTLKAVQTAVTIR